MTMKNVGAVLDKTREDLFAALKPLQEHMAEQKKGVPAANPLSDLPWQVSLNQSASKWLAAPKADQAIVLQKDGSYKLVTGTAAMGAGGLLGIIENPLNGFWPAVPIGSILVGGFTGVLAGELIDAFFPPRTSTGGVNITNVAVKGGGILLLTMWGPMLMSRTGSTIAIAILGVQMLSDLLPIDQWIMNLVNWIKKLFGQTTTAQNRQLPMREVAAPGGFMGRQQDLYAGIFGGR